jgi:hypothetical protein
LWFKFIGENVPYLILPYFVLYAIYYLVDHLTRQAGPVSMAVVAEEPEQSQRQVGFTQSQSASPPLASPAVVSAD